MAERGRKYWLPRLYAFDPKLAAEVEQKKISLREAQVRAGFVHPQPPINDLRRAWRKAAPDDQELFKLEIGLGVAGKKGDGLLRLMKAWNVAGPTEKNAFLRHLQETIRQARGHETT